SRRLGEILGVEVVHLDALYWRPGWVETPKPEWRRRVEELVRRDSWIIDGNYSGTFDIRFEACDTVIFLDVPRLICLWRVLKRRALYRKGGRPDMAQGCDEKLDLEFLKFLRWVWDYPTRTRSKVLKLMRENSPGEDIFLLRTQADIEGFLKRVRCKAARSPADAPSWGTPRL
ncbi:MAG: AAA family ATPase, partial [Acidobacteria bacterium]|nr:AAA family ATPase [Acidobacteriota bacterium]